MVLGADRIVEMIRTGVEVEENGRMTSKPLIEPLNDDQVDGIEGTTVDLRLGAVYRQTGPARLMRDDRITPKIETILDIDNDPDGVLVINPGDYLLVKTIETVNMPTNLFAYLRPRTTMIRSGLALETAFVSPNYQGFLTVGLKHQGHFPVEIQLGFRILCIAFYPIDGEAVPYRGVWQGGRVSTDGQSERPF